MTSVARRSRRPAAPPEPTPWGESLLTTRFRAPTPPVDLVTRPGLLDAVRRGVQLPLTLVSAPAGSGKTVLISSWYGMRETPGPVVWLGMEAGGTPPGVFWAYVVDGLRRSGVDVGSVGMPARAESVDRTFLSRLAARIAEQPDPVVLILDDAVDLAEAALADGVGYLLRGCGGNLRLVLITRVDPALPLHRYRLDHSMVAIRAADLAFTAHETSALMQMSGLELSHRDIEALRDRTTGWAAGLKFAAMSLTGRSDVDQAIRDFTGDEGSVAAYLLTEVLDGQPPELRDFLLRSSIVDELTPGLVDTLSDGPIGARTLEFVAQANPFLQRVEGARGCYRYQPLFRELLRAQLDYERPDLGPRLHRAAATWLAQEGDLPRAVRHAVIAGEWAEATALLVDELGIAMLEAGRDRVELRGLLDDLPLDCATGPAHLVRAALASAAGRSASAREELDLARPLVESDTSRRAAARRATIALLEAQWAHRDGDAAAGLEAVRAAERALPTCSGKVLAVHPELVSILELTKARLHWWLGDIERARPAFLAATALAQAPGCEGLLTDSLGLHALAAATHGEPQVASDLAECSAAAARLSGTESAYRSAAATAALAWVALEDYDLVGVGDALLDAEAVELTEDDTLVSLVLRLVRSRLRLLHGDPAGALAQLATPDTGAADRRSPAWVSQALADIEATARAAADPPAEPPDAGTPLGAAGDLIVESLTLKEREVLGHLAALLTTEEIAATMFVSVNTVRTHVRNILRKLAVSRRNQAVRRGWELHLLPTRHGTPSAGRSA